MLISPFKTIGRSTALDFIRISDKRLAESMLNRMFYDGEHWMNGDGWMGPIPSIDNRTYDDVKEEVRRVFCSRNVILEVTDRRVDGLFKSKPSISFSLKDAPNDEAEIAQAQLDLIGEANTLFENWANSKRLLKRLKEIYGRGLIGERVVLRLYIPRGYLTRTPDGRTQLPTGTLEEMINMIHLELIVNKNAGEIVDEDTQLIAMATEAIKKNLRYTEIVYTENEDTVIRTITDSYSDLLFLLSPESVGNSNDLGTEWRLKLGKRLTMYESKIRTCISQQVRENQMAINLSKTMQNRNTVTAGFLERIILDAMPPGKWIKDPDDPEKEIYEVGPFKVGGGTTNFFMAAESRDGVTGETRYGNPSVYTKEPSSSSTFIDSKRDCYQDILEEVGQPHMLISGDATASGKSREQARETFRGTLEDDEGELNDMVTWLAETLLAMGSFLANKQGHFQELQAEVKCYINSGPLAGTERQDLRENVKSGLLSRKTAMSRDGVENPQAELEQIEFEAEDSDEAKDRQIGMLERLYNIGIMITGAAKFIGIKDDQAKELVVDTNRQTPLIQLPGSVQKPPFIKK